MPGLEEPIGYAVKATGRACGNAEVQNRIRKGIHGDEGPEGAGEMARHVASMSRHGIMALES